MHVVRLLCLYSCTGEQETQASELYLLFAPEKMESANDDVCAVSGHHRKAQ